MDSKIIGLIRMTVLNNGLSMLLVLGTLLNSKPAHSIMCKEIFSHKIDLENFWKHESITPEYSLDEIVGAMTQFNISSELKVELRQALSQGLENINNSNLANTPKPEYEAVYLYELGRAIARTAGAVVNNVSPEQIEQALTNIISPLQNANVPLVKVPFAEYFYPGGKELRNFSSAYLKTSYVVVSPTGREVNFQLQPGDINRVLELLNIPDSLKSRLRSAMAQGLAANAIKGQQWSDKQLEFHSNLSIIFSRVANSENVPKRMPDVIQYLERYLSPIADGTLH